MMKVQGTEPVVLTKIVDLTARKDVKDAQKSAIDMNLNARKEVPQNDEAAVPEKSFVPDETIDRINATMKALNIRLKFEKHESSGQYMVRVVNEETNEVVREIPPEKTLDMIVHLRKLVGIIVDERV